MDIDATLVTAHSDKEQPFAMASNLRRHRPQHAQRGASPRLTNAPGQPLIFTRMTSGGCSSPARSSPACPAHRPGHRAPRHQRNPRQHSRRRALRPTEEYRIPTDAEWQEFLGHFERRKVSAGLCGRAFATPCIREHAFIRCPMLWPEPAQRPRIASIRDNLIARISEAEREGWYGEIEGLKISLAGADDKFAQIDRRTNGEPGNLGMPTQA